MTHATDQLRSRLLGNGHPTTGRMVEALESRLEDDEKLEYQLASKEGLDHKQDDETRTKGGGDGGTLLAATDRKLVFVVDTKTGRETADIPYTDLKRIEKDSGILSTNLVLTVWGRGQFTFTPTDTADVDDLVEFATDASQTVQRVVAALQDARQYISMLTDSMGRGEIEAAEDARDSARENIEKARERTKQGVKSVRRPLRARIETVETELFRARMEARQARAQDLVETAVESAEQSAYDEAHETFRQARANYETALGVAVEGGFDEAGDIQTQLWELEAKVEDIEARPLELAEEARAQAQAARDPERAVVAWETALEHYRDALTAGWGTDADFDGDTGALQMQIEWVVAKIVDARTELAADLEAEGHKLRATGEPAETIDRYESACDQLAMAERLAAQHRAGDAEALRAEQRRIQTKCIAAV